MGKGGSPKYADFTSLKTVVFLSKFKLNIITFIYQASCVIGLMPLLKKENNLLRSLLVTFIPVCIIVYLGYIFNQCYSLDMVEYTH